MGRDARIELVERFGALRSSRFELARERERLPLPIQETCRRARAREQDERRYRDTAERALLRITPPLLLPLFFALRLEQNLEFGREVAHRRSRIRVDGEPAGERLR